MKREKIVGKIFGSITLNPRRMGQCTVSPVNTPFFEPKSCKIVCLDPSDPTKHCDLKIGAVLVGGSPQLSINELTPNETSMGIRPESIDLVNWSICSTVGLARELTISMYNPSDRQVVVFVCIDGIEHASLGYERYATDGMTKEEAAEYFTEQSAQSEATHNEWVLKCEARDEMIKIPWQQISSNEVKLGPLEQRVIPVFPTVSPFFEPNRFRLHGRRESDGQSVPFTVIDVFCGRELLYGSDVETLFNRAPRQRARSGNSALISQLASTIDALQEEQRPERPLLLEDIRGVLSSHMVGEDGWGDASWWPTISTLGLAKSMGVVVYNPWPIEISVSVELEGSAVTELNAECYGREEGDGSAAGH